MELFIIFSNKTHFPRGYKRKEFPNIKSLNCHKNNIIIILTKKEKQLRIL